MNENHFSIQAVINQGIHLYQKHWKKAVIGQLLVVVLGFVAGMAFVSPVIIAGIAGKSFGAIQIAIFSVIGILLLCAIFYFMFGYARLMYKLANGENPSVREIFRGPRTQFWNYFWGKLVASVGILIGFVLLIVPGVILLIGLSLFTFILFDKNLKAIDALKESWRLTKGHRMSIFLFGLIFVIASFIVGLIPVLGNLISAFIISPISFFVMFAIYKTIVRAPVAVEQKVMQAEHVQEPVVQASELPKGE